jgi:hypothetical protein
MCLNLDMLKFINRKTILSILLISSLGLISIFLLILISKVYNFDNLARVSSSNRMVRYYKEDGKLKMIELPPKKETEELTEEEKQKRLEKRKAEYQAYLEEKRKEKSERQKSIERLFQAYEEGKIEPRLIINNRKLYFTSYKSHAGNHFNVATGEWDGRAGIILFEENNQTLEEFWESSDDILMICHSTPIKFLDLNSDNVKEIIITESSCARNWAYYIYEWKKEDNTFKLITPLSDDGRGPVVGGFFQDIDADGIDEIVNKWEEDPYYLLALDIEDDRYFLRNERQQIYKYDGDKYVLWKDEIIREKYDIRENWR